MDSFFAWIFNFENVHPVLRTLHSITVINGKFFWHSGINHDKSENKMHFTISDLKLFVTKGATYQESENCFLLHGSFLNAGTYCSHFNIFCHCCNN